MELPIWAIQFLAGGMGGLVRGLVGITKAQTFNPDTFKFQWKYFTVTIIISIIFDQFAGVVFKRMSLLAGYVYPVYAPL